jgi:hypothetical protein
MNETTKDTIKDALYIIALLCIGMLIGAILNIEEQESVAPLLCPTNAELIDNLTIERNDARHQAVLAEYNLKQVQKNNTKFKDLKGQYNPNNGIITIQTAQLDTYAEAMYVFNHEYAHKVWYEKLSEYERLDWANQFKVATVFPTEYAKERVEEYYAESIAIDIYNRDISPGLT